MEEFNSLYIQKFSSYFKEDTFRLNYKDNVHFLAGRVDRTYTVRVSGSYTVSSESRCALGCSVSWSPTHA
jgi:hypothetical protein